MKRARRSLAVVVAALLLSAVALWACGGATKRQGAAAHDGGLDARALDAPLESAPPRVVDLSLVCPPLASVDAATPLPANPFRPDACTFDELIAVIDCVFSPTSLPSTCEAAAKAPKSCFDCVITPADASTSSALIIDGPVVRLNESGCLGNYVADNVPPGSCARRLALADNCASAACARCLDDGGTLADYEACRTEAYSTTCAGLTSERESCLAFFQPDARAAPCAKASGFTDHAHYLATLFCAYASLDGG